MAVITAIELTPVKGLGLQSRDEVHLGRLGVAENRAFFLVDERATLVNGKRVGELCAVLADYDADAGTLTLRFPDGSVLSEAVRDGDPVPTRFFSRRPMARPVCPELSAALSRYAGRTLALVRADPALTAADRGPESTVSLLSRGSLERLGAEAGGPVDGRRFRMLLEIDGVGAHAEDAFVGRRVRIGAATVHFHGHVGRCRVTTMDPDTGRVDLPTLDLLGYRRDVESTEPLAMGIYGEVIEPGRVAVGDPVVLDPATAGTDPVSAAELPPEREDRP